MTIETMILIIATSALTILYLQEIVKKDRMQDLIKVQDKLIDALEIKIKMLELASLLEIPLGNSKYSKTIAAIEAIKEYIKNYDANKKCPECTIYVNKGTCGECILEQIDNILSEFELQKGES